VDKGGRVENARLLHLQVEIVAFTRALTDAAEHGFAAVPLLHVVDQLHDDDGLADAGTAEESDLSALHERGDEVDDLDARLEDFGLGLEIRELGSRTMDRPPL